MACGDDTTNNNYSTVAIEDYTLKTLPDCDSTMEGQVGFVTTTEELMYCMDGEWMNLNGADGAKGEKGQARRKAPTSKRSDLLPHIAFPRQFMAKKNVLIECHKKNRFYNRL